MMYKSTQPIQNLITKTYCGSHDLLRRGVCATGALISALGLSATLVACGGGADVGGALNSGNPASDASASAQTANPLLGVTLSGLATGQSVVLQDISGVQVT